MKHTPSGTISARWTVRLLKLCLLSVIPLLFHNCSVFKPNFDPVGHEYAVTIQKEALELIQKANESFSLHRDAVYRLMTRVEQAYENARPVTKTTVSRVYGTSCETRNLTDSRTL